MSDTNGTTTPTVNRIPDTDGAKGVKGKVTASGFFAALKTGHKRALKVSGHKFALVGKPKTATRRDLAILAAAQDKDIRVKAPQYVIDGVIEDTPSALASPKELADFILRVVAE